MDAADRPPNLPQLTSLQFFASASIVFFHMQGGLLPMPSYANFALGVSFFFVLSGFILTYVHRSGIDPMDFFTARFMRIWPLHIVTLVLMLALLQWPLLEQRGWWFPLLLNALLLHTWIPIPAYVFSFNGASWSVSAEAFFYLMFPVLVGKHLKLWLTAMAVAVAWILLVLELGRVPADGPSAWQLFPAVFLLQSPVVRILEFAIGVAFGKAFLRRRINSGTTLEVAVLVAAGFFFLTSEILKWQIAVAGLPDVALWYSQSGGALIFAALIFVFAHGAGAVSRILQWRPLVLLGEISFSTYLLHGVVLQYVLYKGLPKVVGLPAALVLTVAIIYIGSYVLWRVVERPSRGMLLALLRSLWRVTRRSVRPVAVAPPPSVDEAEPAKTAL